MGCAVEGVWEVQCDVAPKEPYLTVDLTAAEGSSYEKNVPELDVGDWGTDSGKIFFCELSRWQGLSVCILCQLKLVMLGLSVTAKQLPQITQVLFFSPLDENPLLVRDDAQPAGSAVEYLCCI